VVKPVVHYDVGEHVYIMVGFPAMVHPIDHPSNLVSNEQIVETGKVLGLTETGFETENTIYVAVKRDIVDPKALSIVRRTGWTLDG